MKEKILSRKTSDYFTIVMKNLLIYMGLSTITNAVSVKNKYQNIL